MTAEQVLKKKQEEFNKELKTLLDKYNFMLFAIPNFVPQKDGTFTVSSSVQTMPKPSPIETVVSNELKK